MSEVRRYAEARVPIPQSGHQWGHFETVEGLSAALDALRALGAPMNARVSRGHELGNGSAELPVPVLVATWEVSEGGAALARQIEEELRRALK